MKHITMQAEVDLLLGASEYWVMSKIVLISSMVMCMAFLYKLIHSLLDVSTSRSKLHLENLKSRDILDTFLWKITFWSPIHIMYSFLSSVYVTLIVVLHIYLTFIIILLKMDANLLANKVIIIKNILEVRDGVWKVFLWVNIELHREIFSLYKFLHFPCFTEISHKLHVLF